MCVRERGGGGVLPLALSCSRTLRTLEFCASVRHQQLLQLRCEPSSRVGKILLKVLLKVLLEVLREFLFISSGLYSDKGRGSSSLDGFVDGVVTGTLC